VEVIFQLLIDALLLAGYYALLSSGFSLMWGVSGIINLAYGSFVLVGAYDHCPWFNIWCGPSTPFDKQVDKL
jgi:branched-subunit amino acid ABC-type transport system permease component